MILSKNTKIFLSIFSVLLFAITIIAILYTNTHKTSNESQIIIESSQKMGNSGIDNSGEMTDTTRGVSLNDTYSTNGVTYTYTESERKGINIRYPVIDGLNNSETEDSVNKQIIEKINKVLDSNNFKNNSDSSAYAEATVVGNFADVLSVKFYVKFNEEFSKNYGINFRLDTGERIKISDMFTYNAPKKNIITQSAYKSFALAYYTNEGISNDFYTNVDSDILNFLIDFNDGKIAEFSFTPMYIELYRDGKKVRIEMQKYAEYIAIYNRYKEANNLYANRDKIIESIPVFTERPECIADLYEKVNDTCVLDVCINKSERENTDFSSKEMQVINNYKKYLSDRLQVVRNEKDIYYSNYVVVSRGKEDGEDVLIFSEKEAFIKAASRDDFNTYYNNILDAERNINNEDYEGSKIYVLEEDTITEGTFEVKFSLETGREYKKEEIDEEENEGGDDEREGEIEPMPNPEPTPNSTPNPTPTPDESVRQEQVPESTPTPTPVPTEGDITTQVTF